MPLLPSRACRAFTLLELIVALIVLGLLAAIAVPTYQQLVNRSASHAAAAEMAALHRSALTLALLDDEPLAHEHYLAAATEFAAGPDGSYAAGVQVIAGRSTDRNLISVGFHGEHVGLARHLGDGTAAFVRARRDSPAVVSTWVADTNLCPATGTNAAAGPDEDCVTAVSLPVTVSVASHGLTGRELRFDATIYEPGATYTWDFGDGTTLPAGPDPVVEHIYQSAGTFTATVAVTSPDGTGIAAASVSIEPGTTQLVAATFPAAPSYPHAIRTTVDGRYVAFVTTDALAAGDTNNRQDIYLRDLTDGTTTLVSADADGTTGTGAAQYPALSEDGRYVAFEAAPGSFGNVNHGVFRKDLHTGALLYIHEGLRPDISDDGQRVVFGTGTANVPQDQNGTSHDIYLKDLTDGTLTLVSAHAGGLAGGSAEGPRLADADTTVTFTGADIPGTGDTNGRRDIYRHDLSSGTVELVSATAAGTPVATGTGSFNPSVTPDGRYITWESAASDLVPGDSNGSSDVFLRDMVAGVTTRVSVDENGAELAGISYQSHISPDGRYVGFATAAVMGPADTNNRIDAVVKDRHTGELILVSRTPSGATADTDAKSPVPVGTSGKVVWATGSAAYTGAGGYISAPVR